MKPVKFTLSVLLFCLAMASCSKDKRAQPNVSLKTGDTYIAADATVDTSTVVTIGFVADETAAPLRTFSITSMYDGSHTVYTVENTALPDKQASHYERDFRIQTRNLAGSEKWIFTITDQDGNRAQKSITLNTQIP